MTKQTASMNSEEARKKREATFAKKKAIEETDQKMMVIAKQIPTEWAGDEDQKLSLLKSIYTDVLGTYVEKAYENGKEIEIVRNRPLADLRLFMFQASQRNLNPFKKQIHAVYIWDSNAKAEKLVPITGIDGFATIAQRTNRYAGLSETRFEMFDDTDEEHKGLPKCAVIDVFAYNPVTGAREVVTTATAWWEEYAKYKEEWKYDPAQRKKVPTGNKTLNSVWQNRPKGQLEKCAQALGLRRAFPEELSGLYVYQEVDRLQERPDVIEHEDNQPTAREKIEAALDKRKAEGKNVANGDVGNTDGKSADNVIKSEHENDKADTGQNSQS